MPAFDVNTFRKYERLIYKIISKYPDLYSEDLFQESCVALYQATLKWDPAKASFSTFAYKYISWACFRFMQDKAYVVRVPAHLYLSNGAVECRSLSEPVFDECALDSLIGVDSEEDNLDITLTLDTKLKQLVRKRVISKADYILLYNRYFLSYTLEELAQQFDSSPSVLSHRIKNRIARIRPYFFRKMRTR